LDGITIQHVAVLSTSVKVANTARDLGVWSCRHCLPTLSSDSYAWSLVHWLMILQSG